MWPLSVFLLFYISSTYCQLPNSNVSTSRILPKPTEPTIVDYRKKPPRNEWPVTYDRRKQKKYILGEWLLTGSWGDVNKTFTRGHYEYEGYDGFYNNLARPDSGAIDKPLLRRWPADYEDGTYLPSGRNRPNPLELSEKLLKGDIGTHSRTGKNALLVFFGQQVVEEILDAQRPACPPEYFNINIPKWHSYTKVPGHTELPLLRTRYDQRTGLNPNNPRQQLNEITPYIDGGLFYGITKQWSDSLRMDENGNIHPNGSLASSHDGLFPAYNTQRLPMANPPPPFHHKLFITQHETAEVSRFFKLGNPRGNENAFLLTFGIMWFRWHNYIAETIKKLQPDWSSEEIFNEARKWVIATQQHIIVDEWLPALLNKKLPRYKEYDPSINPQIDQFFQAAAFRFGHTLVTPGVYLRDYIRKGCKHRFNTWKNAAVRTCNIFWRPQDPILTPEAENSKDFVDIDRLLMGMSVQLCEEEDHKIIEDLRGNVFGPLEFPRRDLMAINIQRGRDHGLPGFNAARKAFGLAPVNFSHFQHLPSTIQKELTTLYNSPDDVDVWVGGILETRDGPGELFETIILDQFRRIRDGDRFWFENKENGMFSQEDIARIRELKVYDIIMAVTKMDAEDVPEFPFNVPHRNMNMDENSPLVKNCSLEWKPCRLQNQTPFDCWHLPFLNQTSLGETCKQGYSYDYFWKSEAPYIGTFTALGVFVIGCFSFIFFLVQQKNRMMIRNAQMRTNATMKSVHRSTGDMNSMIFGAQEWISKKQPVKNIAVVFDTVNKQIKITCQQGNLMRAIDLGFANVFKIYVVTDMPYLVINSRHSYDLVLHFPTDKERNEFRQALKEFIDTFQLEYEEISVFKWKDALNIITTKKDRQKKLEMFYRVVFAQAFKINHSKTEILAVSSNDKDIINTEITVLEFAESLNMKPDNEFVKRMFYLADKDRNGFISFREFVGLLIIFAEGNEEQKAQLLFKMYDIDDTGVLKAEDFESMIRCFLETVGGNIPENKLKQTIHGMLSRAHCENKSELEFQDFLKILGRDIVNLNKAKLGFKGFEDDGSYLTTARNTIENIYGTVDINSRFKGEASEQSEDTYMSNIIDQEQKKILDNKEYAKDQTDKMFSSKFLKYVELKSKDIFWLSLYTLILWIIFLERAYYYSFEREHSGLRRIAGYGVTITRGAASAQMFTYSSLLVTMCRNTITILRDTVANKYFPFDASVEIHKYIAWWAFFFTVLHIVGHAFNFYHISTQTADDLTCLFRNYFHATHELPKFQYWCWQTITGFTGIMLTLIWMMMFIFALSYVRSKIYNWFWYTHSLYPLFYIFMILHGMGRLIQEPFFYYFFLGPVILFTIDSLISISRKKIEIPVVKADVLPSSVTMLEFQKPDNFQYKSGQWVRIACMALNKHEYHPFTLTSSPNEDTLKLHIRSVGPWTTHIRTIYEEANTLGNSKKLPKIYLDGPYGEGHQDWNNYDVSILIGGGIGVTPFASILKDIAYRSGQTRCKKVYFIWVSRTQKQFEWLIDIIREVEYKDVKNVISCHIFITQFFEKFDLRMILLYVMERHYQRVANRSLFTNLKAVTHFGRPSFAKIFKTVQTLHEHTPRIGVFSCGPPSMTSSVNAACFAVNFEGYHRFEHHYKNF
ncbi:dual oxidase 1-like [Coccinella septempunctata]|uniref:dual oxidase 1-like n=1 Tax=Coccinella septempunctata TaxID=41139 RepID=UPI001D05F5C8|nr:dual oxidase 1-like [Coccinella septempunctata]